MTDQGETFQRISVAEAARHLGVSAATVRRRIRAGEFEAATVLRTQGTAFVVRLPLDACAGVADVYDREQGPGSSTRAQASGPEAMTALIQTTIATVLGPLMAELAASRQANERQADELKELARENGRQSAELEAARARISTLEASGAPHTVEAAPPRAVLEPLAHDGTVAAARRDPAARVRGRSAGLGAVVMRLPSRSQAPGA